MFAEVAALTDPLAVERACLGLLASWIVMMEPFLVDAAVLQRLPG